MCVCGVSTILTCICMCVCVCSDAPVGAPDVQLAQQSHFLPVESFDDELDELHTSEEWVALGQSLGDAPGTPCFSRYRLLTGETEWRAAYALDYNADEGTFLIEWAANQKQKYVKRYACCSCVVRSSPLMYFRCSLNLRFAAENEQAFLARLQRAEARRNEAESLLRYHLYVQEKFDAVVEPLADEQLRRILNMVAYGA